MILNKNYNLLIILFVLYNLHKILNFINGYENLIL